MLNSISVPEWSRYLCKLRGNVLLLGTSSESGWGDLSVGAHRLAGHAGVECGANVLRVDCQVSCLAQVRQCQCWVLQRTWKKALVIHVQNSNLISEMCVLTHCHWYSYLFCDFCVLMRVWIICSSGTFGARLARQNQLWIRCTVVMRCRTGEYKVYAVDTSGKTGTLCQATSLPLLTFCCAATSKWMCTSGGGRSIKGVWRQAAPQRRRCPAGWTHGRSGQCRQIVPPTWQRTLMLMHGKWLLLFADTRSVLHNVPGTRFNLRPSM